MNCVAQFEVKKKSGEQCFGRESYVKCAPVLAFGFCLGVAIASILSIFNTVFLFT